jgi:uroporphyrin-3 C-methyltransferase
MPKSDKKATATESASKEAVVNSESAQKTSSDEDKLSRRKLPFAIMLVVVLGLSVVIGVIWVIGQQWQAQTSQAEQISVLNNTLEQQQESSNEERDAILSAQAAQQELIVLLSTQLQNLQLQANVQGVRLSELSTTSRSDWFLSEAVYLARLARQRLHTERSTKNPVALLKQVDDILVALDDLDVLPVRSAVAKDIAALRLAGDVDVNGIVVELNALISHVDRLPLITYTAPVENKAPVTVDKVIHSSDQDMMQRWLVTLDELGASLSNLIRVRQRSNPIEPILTDREEAIARGNLHLLLQQAANAALREQQEVYQVSLVSAEQWIADYFRDAPATSSVRKRLQALQSAQIVQQLPIIDATINALDAFIILRQNRLIQSSSEEGDVVNKTDET